MNGNGFAHRRAGWISALLFFVATGMGCGSSADGLVLRADAEYDPATVSDTSWPIAEVTPGAAQSFTVLADGQLDEFWFVITQGESLDDGVIRITVRPTDATGVPDSDPNSSIIRPIDVDTTSLPPVLVDEFSVFNVGDEVAQWMVRLGIEVPKNGGSSVETFTRTPAFRRRSMECSRHSVNTPSETLEPGQTASGTPSFASRSTSKGSSIARTPWSTRSSRS